MSVVRPDFVKKIDLSAHGKDKIQKRRMGEEGQFSPQSRFSEVKRGSGKKGNETICLLLKGRW